MFWHYSPNGIYDVKSGYWVASSIDHVASSSSPSSSSKWWHSLWSLSIPRKVCTFVWKAFHNALPTYLGLHIRKVLPHSHCPLCVAHEDIIYHSLVLCPSSRSIWKQANLPCKVHTLLCSSFNDLLQRIHGIWGKNLLEWIIILAWCIWFEINKQVHGQCPRCAPHIVCWARTYLEDYSRAQSSSQRSLP